MDARSGRSCSACTSSRPTITPPPAEPAFRCGFPGPSDQRSVGFRLRIRAKPGGDRWTRSPPMWMKGGDLVDLPRWDWVASGTERLGYLFAEREVFHDQP